MARKSTANWKSKLKCRNKKSNQGQGNKSWSGQGRKVRQIIFEKEMPYGPEVRQIKIETEMP